MEPRAQDRVINNSLVELNKKLQTPLDGAGDATVADGLLDVARNGTREQAEAFAYEHLGPGVVMGDGPSQPWASPWNPFPWMEPSAEQIGEHTFRINVTEPPVSLVEEARQANPGVNGQLASLDRAELIAMVEKLQRRARTHRKTITELNAKHAEDLRRLESRKSLIKHQDDVITCLREKVESFERAADMFNTTIQQEGAWSDD